VKAHCIHVAAFAKHHNEKEIERSTPKYSMDIISLIIQVISGAIGGNVAGAAMKESSLGTLGNSDTPTMKLLILYFILPT
jgi:hypothetical protein